MEAKTNVRTTLKTMSAPAVAVLMGLLVSPSYGQQPQVNVTAPVTEGNTAMAISYPEGPTLGVKFKGTYRLPKASGEAKVERKRGMTEIEIELDEMKPATFFGGDYSTYVLWVVSPEGQVDNIGEFVLRGNRSKLNVSTPQQTFGLFITAEPHFLVRTPSRFVVLENTRPANNLTSQLLKTSTIKYRGFDGSYTHRRETLVGEPEEKGEIRSDVRQAIVSVKLAERAGAQQFASDELGKARVALEKTLEASEANLDPRQLMVLGHETVRLAVDAETKAQERSFQAALDDERKTRAAEISGLKVSIEQAQSEADRAKLLAQQKQLEANMEKAARDSALARAEEAARLAAEEARRREEAERKAAALSQEKQAAEALAAQAAAKAAQTQEEAERIRRERDEARERMRSALSVVVETRETARGLVVNLPDILFDVDKANLKPQAREILSKVCGILSVAGGYNLSIEGHTDSTGSDEHNQKLSERRAQSVYDYLGGCGMTTSAMASKGFGETQPLADNNTNDGRQKNRRVEIVISDNQTAATGTPRNQ